LLHQSRSDEKAKKTLPQGHFRFTGHSTRLSGRTGMFVLGGPTQPDGALGILGARSTEQHEAPLAWLAAVE
jgi:hypothetical protein